jgi:hypothetical protein
MTPDIAGLLVMADTAWEGVVIIPAKIELHIHLPGYGYSGILKEARLKTCESTDQGHPVRMAL